MPAHSEAFVLVRDALLRLEDAERCRVAALVGAMHAPQPPLSSGVAHILGLIGRLDPDDRRRLAKWCERYLSRWGQVPVAASRTQATPRAGSDAVTRR